MLAANPRFLLLGLTFGLWLLSARMKDSFSDAPHVFETLFLRRVEFGDGKLDIVC